MELVTISYPKETEPHSKELVSRHNNGVVTTLGTVFLKKGTRIPETGFSRHPFNEVSIITKGCIEMINEAEEVIGYLKKGTAVYINAGEPQAGYVKEDTELIYVLNQFIES
tara:strand:- start:309561 stop:309893 length:333 start_codon:yes stop_codon:yes gene_type:complete